MLISLRILAIAFLSLGFLGQSPWSSPTATRRISSSCVDPSSGKVVTTAPKYSHTSSFVPWMQEAIALQPIDSFGSFRRQLSWQESIYGQLPFTPYSPWSPFFPSYALPSLLSNPVSLDLQPRVVSKVWGGVSAEDSRLKFIFDRAGPTSNIGNAALKAEANGLLELAPAKTIQVSKF